MDINQKITKKNLPHNFLAEQILLNCLISNSETTPFVNRFLSIDAFYFKNHQEIYKALIFMSKNQLAINILSLTNFLQENGLLKKIGGIKVLLEITNQSSNVIYLDEYIRLIKEKFLRRSLIQLGYQLINSGHITNITFEKLLTEFEIEIFNLTNTFRSQPTLSSAQVLNNLFVELKEKFLHPQLPGLPSGFSSLDLLTQGFQNSDLIILAGRPSMGKTALSLNIALNVIKGSRLPVLFFSLEMSKEQIMYRILSLETKINQIRLKNGKLYQNDWIKLTKIIKILSKLPFFIDDTANLSIPDLRLKIQTILLKQTKIGVIIIDYLQLMHNSEFKTVNRVQELSYITRSLKTLAREFNIPIIALSQLSRNVENRIDQKPILSDLRESGSIEQDADLILMLSRTKSDFSHVNQKSFLTELIIAKQRNGPTGIVKFQFNENQMFSELKD